MRGQSVKVAMRAKTGRLSLSNMSARMCPLRFQPLESRHSRIGPPKSRLLGALVGRSIEVRLSSKADIRLAAVIDHHGPIADSRTLLDYVVGLSKKRWRNGEAECLSPFFAAYQLLARATHSQPTRPASAAQLVVTSIMVRSAPSNAAIAS
jgi:hypothetical protein